MDFEKKIQNDIDAVADAKAEWTAANGTYEKAVHGQAAETHYLETDTERREAADKAFGPAFSPFSRSGFASSPELS